MSYYDHASEYALQRQRQLNPRKMKTWELEKIAVERRRDDLSATPNGDAGGGDNCRCKRAANTDSDVKAR